MAKTFNSFKTFIKIKKLPIFLTLLLMLGEVASAQIYKCDFLSGEVVIDTKDNERLLKSENPETGKSENQDMIYSANGSTGRVTFIPKIIFTLSKKTYDAYVFQNSKPGDQNYFKIVFFDDTITLSSPNTIVIKTWNKNLPAFLYLADSPDKVDTGNCK